MTFAHPLALLWLLLAVPIVLLYRQRLKLRQEPVATDMIWQQVFAEDGARKGWQRRRHPVSLAVQLTVLGLIVIGLLDVQIPSPRQIVLIVDNSASMNATDVQPSRLEVAKETARRVIEGLRPCDSAAILSVGGTVGVHCNLTNDQTVLKGALSAVSPSSDATHMEAAVALARRMLHERSGGTIWPLTDGRFPGASELAAAAEVKFIRIGKQTDNLAVTRLQVRRHPTDPLKYQVLAEVSSFADQPVACGLKVALDGNPLETMSIELPPSGRRQHFFDIPAVEAGTLTVELDRLDDFPDDNQASRKLPPDESAAMPAIKWADMGESDLRVSGELGIDAATVPGGRPWPAAWLYLTVLGVMLLALEWCFYQRRWIC